MREDHAIPKPKQPGQIRLLFLGDSVTFGYLVSHTETFVQRAEEELRARFPDASIECINAGVPGYTLFQGWGFLETEGYSYSTPYQLEMYRYGRRIAFGPDRSYSYVDGVSVVEKLALERSTSELFFDSVHITPLANQKIAEAVVSKVAPWIKARMRK